MGKLVIVPTPIGNLGDITYRSVETLKKADIILAEDTRKTGVLLAHYGIEKKVIPHHKFNEHKTVLKISEIIKSGKTVALVSDGGTPGISDPGFLLVRTSVENGIEVECLPGASAFLPALIDSGLPTDRFCFEGFLPRKKGRQKRLNELAEEKRTLVFYESPHRLIKTLVQISEVFGSERQASVSRELTKVFEETVRGSLSTLVNHFENSPPRGEIVIVVAGRDK